MSTWFSDMLERSSAFIPHGHCYLWIPGLLWLHVISDALIGLAYVGISLILYLLVRQIRLPFSWVFIAFGLFIGLCGITHFFAIWTVWNPDYWLDGMVKAATALASVATAIGLFHIRPQIIDLVHTARLSEERRIQLETNHAELEALYRKVKDVDQIKMQFFANISHELRTPLALIMGPAEKMLEKEDLDAEQKQQLETIRRNSTALLKQVNDLLDVARLEEGHVQLHVTRIDLAHSLQQTSGQFDIIAAGRQVTFTLKTPNCLFAEMDADLFDRIIINLLSNAFKFTPAGGQVMLALQREEDCVVITVEDSGAGIPEDKRQIIFERFRQADGSVTRKHGGSGLGLAIVNDYVELLQGSIRVDSSALGGARFTVRLPLLSAGLLDSESELLMSTTRASALVETEVLKEQLRKPGPVVADVAGAADRPTVLLIEDNEEMRHFTASVLSSNYNVLTAGDGREGLAQAMAVRPDVLITDIMMPEMSGDQLIAELRARREFDTLPILLLSAKADDKLRVKLLQEGAQDYLAKPFLPQELRVRAGNLVSAKRAGDAMRRELSSISLDIESLAAELAGKHRQLQLAYEATQVARAQAEHASQAKSQFLALISHEMRTPLSTILLNAEMVARQDNGVLSEPTRIKVDRVIRGTRQLSTLIEGLLQYTRVESGRLESHQEEVDLEHLTQELIDAAQGEVTKDLRLLRDIEGDLPLLRSDAKLIRVIISNLLSNAIKFTNKGEVGLTVRGIADWVELEVRDTGPGIPEADFDRIFQPFEQLEPVHSKSIPGVGLGLALVKEIVNALGGDVVVRSREGEGSTFLVRLPLVAPLPQPVHAGSH